jgi:hypothetical protein
MNEMEQPPAVEILPADAAEALQPRITAHNVWTACDCARKRYRDLLVPVLCDLWNGHIDLATIAMGLEAVNSRDAAEEEMVKTFPNEPLARIQLMLDLASFRRRTLH